MAARCYEWRHSFVKNTAEKDLAGKLPAQLLDTGQPDSQIAYQEPNYKDLKGIYCKIIKRGKCINNHEIVNAS